MRHKEDEKRILDLLETKGIPIPDYSRIYHGSLKKIKGNPIPWFLLLPIAVILIFLMTPKSEGPIYEVFDKSEFSFYYFEADLVNLESDLNNYSDPYSWIFELNNDQLRSVVDELKGE